MRPVPVPDEPQKWRDRMRLRKTRKHKIQGFLKLPNRRAKAPDPFEGAVWGDMNSPEMAAAYIARFDRLTLDRAPSAYGCCIGLKVLIDVMFPTYLFRRSPGGPHVLLAGANTAEVGMAVQWSQASASTPEFPRLLITAVGPAITPAIRDAARIVPSLDVRGGLLATYYYQTLAEPKPDAIVLFHPGLEYSRGLWLRDEGLLQYVSAGVPVMVTAYTREEALTDRALLQAYGYRVGALYENPLAPAIDGSDRPEGERVAHFMYSIDGVHPETWNNPDRAAFDQVMAPTRERLGAIPAKRIFVQRDKVLSEGPIEARMKEHYSFEAAAKQSNHPTPYLRELFSARKKTEPFHDYYAATFVSYCLSDGKGKLEDVAIDYLRRHPEFINAPDGLGWRPLHWAAVRKSAAMLDFLLAAGADVNLLSDMGLTALSLAVSRSDRPAIHKLLAAGALVRIGDQSPDLLSQAEHQLPIDVRRLLMGQPTAPAGAAQRRTRAGATPA